MDDVSGFVMSSYRCTGSYVISRYVLILLLMTSSIGGSVRFRVFGCDGIGVGMSVAIVVLKMIAVQVGISGLRADLCHRSRSGSTTGAVPATPFPGSCSCHGIHLSAIP